MSQMNIPYSNCSKDRREQGVHKQNRKDDFLSQGNEVSVPWKRQDKDVDLWGGETITVDWKLDQCPYP